MTVISDPKRERKIILKTFRILLLTGLILSAVGTFMFLLSFHINSTVVKYGSLAAGLLTAFTGGASLFRSVRILIPGSRNLSRIIDGNGDVVWFYTSENRTSTGSFFRVVFTWNKSGRNKKNICDSDDLEYLIECLETRYPDARRSYSPENQADYSKDPTLGIL